MDEWSSGFCFVDDVSNVGERGTNEVSVEVMQRYCVSHIRKSDNMVTSEGQCLESGVGKWLLHQHWKRNPGVSFQEVSDPHAGCGLLRDGRGLG